MESEALQSLAEVTSGREPAESTTPPPSEPTQTTSVHEDQNMLIQSPEQTEPCDNVASDTKELVVPDKNGTEMIQSPSIKTMDLSTTNTEESSRTCPDTSKCSSRSTFVADWR